MIADKIKLCTDMYAIKFNNLFVNFKLSENTLLEDSKKLNEISKYYLDYIDDKNYTPHTPLTPEDCIKLKLMIIKDITNKILDIELMLSLEVPKSINDLIECIDNIQASESREELIKNLVDIKNIITTFNAITNDIKSNTKIFNEYYDTLNEIENIYICTKGAQDKLKFAKTDSIILNILATNTKSKYTDEITWLNKKFIKTYNEMYKMIHEQFETSDLEYYTD